MKKIILVLTLILTSGLLFYNFQGNELTDEDTNTHSASNSAPKNSGQKPQINQQIKILSENEFEKIIKLNETEKKFLNSFVETENDLVIAQAVLLSRHSPQSSHVEDLKKAVFFDPNGSVNSIAKFINHSELPGFELEKTALLSLGEQIALNESSKQSLKDASKTELLKMIDDLKIDESNLVGPEGEINFIKSLSQTDSNKLASAISYFKMASKDLSGVVQHKEVINLLKEIDSPVLKNIMARNYFETSKEKLSTDALSDLKDAGVNYDSYSKSDP
jgi:hypothetical protein